MNVSCGSETDFAAHNMNVCLLERLPAISNLDTPTHQAYFEMAPAKSGAGIRAPDNSKAHNRIARFFYA